MYVGKVGCAINPTLNISLAVNWLRYLQSILTNIAVSFYYYSHLTVLIYVGTPITFEWQSTESTSYAKWRMNTSISYFHLPGLSYVAVYSLLQITPTRRPLIAVGEINC